MENWYILVKCGMVTFVIQYLICVSLDGWNVIHVYIYVLNMLYLKVMLRTYIYYMRLCMLCHVVLGIYVRELFLYTFIIFSDYMTVIARS